MTAVLVFVAQFALVFLLGFQSRCVRDSNYLFAMGNSVLLGICGLVITPAIADPELLRSSPMVLVAYLSAGPLAIGLAIWVHDAHFVRKESGYRRQASGIDRFVDQRLVRKCFYRWCHYAIKNQMCLTYSEFCNAVEDLDVPNRPMVFEEVQRLLREES